MQCFNNENIHFTQANSNTKPISNYGGSSCRGFSILKIKDWIAHLDDNNPHHVSFNYNNTVFNQYKPEIIKIVNAENDHIEEFNLEHSINIIVDTVDLYRYLAHISLDRNNMMSYDEVLLGNFSIDGHAMAIKIHKFQTEMGTNILKITLFDPDKEYHHHDIDGVSIEIAPKFQYIGSITKEFEELVERACATHSINKLNNPNNVLMMNLFSYYKPQNEKQYIRNNVEFPKNKIIKFIREDKKLVYSDLPARLCRKHQVKQAVELYNLGAIAFANYKDKDWKFEIYLEQLFQYFTKHPEIINAVGLDSIINLYSKTYHEVIAFNRSHSLKFNKFLDRLHDYNQKLPQKNENIVKFLEAALKLQHIHHWHQDPKFYHKIEASPAKSEDSTDSD